MRKTIIKSLYFILILYFICFTFNSCKKSSYTKEEAERSLKVMNSDLVNLFSKVSEQNELGAIRFLWQQPSAAVPFPDEKFVANEKYIPYNFSKNRGIYLWDSERQIFTKTDTSDIIVFKYLPGLQKGEFHINKFESQAINSRPEFPVKFEAFLLSQSEKIVSITHAAKINDNLPLESETEIKGPDYNLIMKFNRTRESETGTAKLTAKLMVKKTTVLELLIDTRIGYSQMGYFFNKIHISLYSFNHKVEGNIDYDKVNPTANDYAASFNQNSRIIISEKPFNKKVGKIILDYTHEGKLIDYFILFSDGQKVLLSEYLPFLNKILNLKL